MKIIYKEGKTRDDNIQLIIADENDKYAVGTIAYFKNSLNGQNVQRLAVKNSNDVQLWHNRMKGVYILQILKFRIAEDSISENYQNFRKKYDILIKDKISQL